jgi:Spy/CpxP family protein refolding chaperone
MKKTLIISLALGVIAVGALGVSTARGSARWLQQHRSHFLAQHIAHDLNLTDDQKAQIKTVLINERPTIQALMKKFEQQNDQLRSKPAFDEAYVRTVAQQQSSSYTDAIVEREKIRAQIMQILTPDQQQKLAALGAEFRSAIEDRLANLGGGL